MNKVLRRRSAALAVAALAAALLLPQVAGALPGAGGQGARPAAQAAVGAAQGAGATGQAASAGPDLPCRGGLSASQADRQAQQLASQRGSNSTSQVVPQSNCCPIGCPPPPPPPPPPFCGLTIGDAIQDIPAHTINVNGGVSCLGSTSPRSITLTVQLYSTESPNPVKTTVVSRIGGSTAAGIASWYPCSTGRWYGKVSASVYWGPGYQPSSRSYGPLTGAAEQINCVA